MSPPVTCIFFVLFINTRRHIAFSRHQLEGINEVSVFGIVSFSHERIWYLTCKSSSIFLEGFLLMIFFKKLKRCKSMLKVLFNYFRFSPKQWDVVRVIQGSKSKILKVNVISQKVAYLVRVIQEFLLKAFEGLNCPRVQVQKFWMTQARQDFM